MFSNFLMIIAQTSASTSQAQSPKRETTSLHHREIATAKIIFPKSSNCETLDIIKKAVK